MIQGMDMGMVQLCITVALGLIVVGGEWSRHTIFK